MNGVSESAAHRYFRNLYLLFLRAQVFLTEGRLVWLTGFRVSHPCILLLTWYCSVQVYVSLMTSSMNASWPNVTRTWKWLLIASFELYVIARNFLPPSVTKEQKVPLHWLYRASPGQLSRYIESLPIAVQGVDDSDAGRGA
jgi:hypothetical protein